MAQAINTGFDKIIEEDVFLEQVDGKAPPVQVTLQNAENVYKSFLYLRKMYSNFQAKKTILDMGTVNYSALTSVDIPEGSNVILVNNHSSATASIAINNKEYILQSGEKESFPLIAPDSASVPVVAGDVLELKGSVSYIIKNIQDY